MQFEIEGRVERITEDAVISEKFKKRELVLVIEESTDYPQTILIEVVNDRCAILDEFKEGDYVRVFTNLRGRKWTSPKGDERVFISLNGWKMELLDPGPGGAPDETSAPVIDDDKIPF